MPTPSVVSSNEWFRRELVRKDKVEEIEIEAIEETVGNTTKNTEVDDAADGEGEEEVDYDDEDVDQEKESEILNSESDDAAVSIAAAVAASSPSLPASNENHGCDDENEETSSGHGATVVLNNSGEWV